MNKSTKIVNIKNILKIVLLILTIFTALKSCSYAYTLNDIENYLNYYKFEVDNGSTEYGNNYAINQLYYLYENNYTMFESLFSNIGTAVNPIIRISNNTSNGNVYYKFMDINTQLTLNNANTGYNANYTYWKQVQYTGSTGRYTDNQSGTTGSETIAFTNGIIFTSNLNNNTVALSLTNNNMVTQRQWTYIVNRGGTSPLYTNNNTYVDAFDIRIGQDWDINNVSLRIYYLNTNEEKTILNNIVYVLNSTTSANQYIVRFETQNLLEDETYYIELYYNNQLWRDTENGQRIIKSYNPISPSGDSGSGNIIVDLTQTNQKLDNINNSINNQTQVIISGDKAIENAIIKAESGEIKRDNFWRATYESLFSLDSGDIDELYANIKQEIEKLSGDTNLGEELEILEGMRNTTPDDFVLTWDNIYYQDTIIIPSGELNFNTIVEEWGLERVHELIQLITTAALIFIIYRATWKYIAIGLGIGMEMYDELNEEKETIEQATETWKYNTGKKTITIERDRRYK